MMAEPRKKPSPAAALVVTGQVITGVALAAALAACGTAGSGGAARQAGGAAAPAAPVLGVLPVQPGAASRTASP